MKKNAKRQKLSKKSEAETAHENENETTMDELDIEVKKPTESVLIVAGTYERLLYGLVASYDTENSELKIVPRFIMPSHINCVTTVSIGKKFLASGSADEVIKLFDLKRQKELGSLHEHAGTISKLEFFGSSHLISASTDAKIIIFRTKDWEVLKVLRGHLKPINDISIHPSGKLAISVAQDYTAILWNLLTGQKSMRTKLGYEGQLIRFNSAGDFYAISDKSNNVYVYSITKAASQAQFLMKSRILDFVFVSHVGEDDSKKDYILVAAENKSVHLFDPVSSNLIGSVKLHDNRLVIFLLFIALIKGVCKTSILDNNETTVELLVTVSSDSKVKVWSLNSILENILHSSKKDKSESNTNLATLAEFDSGCRLTCVAASVDPLSYK
ncbi:p21-activated protein kinase-interacting protein 1-like [Smittium culicis]|uniref:p21-activated protein kinase-interacting protein 1-like n=1 Tax=Smittium culicis TaxID=133412 RepID=A0A1R1XHA1_9FUNG|nr:p21-activated protein kinase-interacting protein 1-like [Smittium culicis]